VLKRIHDPSLEDIYKEEEMVTSLIYYYLPSISYVSSLFGLDFEVVQDALGLILDFGHVFKKKIHKFYQTHILPFGFQPMVVT